MNNADLTGQIKLLASALADGETSRPVCPGCGASGSFCLTKEGNQIKYLCFRAACGLRGILGGVPRGALARKPQQGQDPLWAGELDSLNDAELLWISSRFHIDPQWLRHVCYCEADHRVYYPMYNSRGALAGYMARYYRELSYGRAQRGSKALWRPVTSAQPSLWFPLPCVQNAAQRLSMVVLVEDPVSSLRLWSQLGIPSAPLLGTGLKQYQSTSLSELGINKIMIILDKDAIVKATQMLRQIKLLFNVRVIPLTGPDIKDMSIEAVENCHECFIKRK